MSYGFWGWEHAFAEAITEEYPGIRTPRDLYDALKFIWCASTCAPRMREEWTKENPTLGQCSITAFLAQDIFGGKVYGILRQGGNYHCFNVVGDCRFDLTSEQFGGEELCYDDCPEQDRTVHFSKLEKAFRYEYLKRELKKFCENRYKIDTEENRKFLAANTEALLSFGHGFPAPGGSSYYLGDDGTPWKDRNRETWITSRMAHVYSIGTLLQHPGSEELCDAALKGLKEELHDTEHGGWYAGLTKDGDILPTKQCYAHAFVILAASSAVIAKRPGAEELLKEALSIYDEKFWLEEEGLSCDTWNTEFTECDSYRGINANMHTVEAFLAAADVTKDEKYRIRAGRIINHIAVWAKENDYRIPEHFTSDWKMDLEKNKEKPDDPFKPYGATPGHGIEWARLITQWALSTKEQSEHIIESNTENDMAYIQLAEKLYRRAISDAWNKDGAPGIVYTTDWNGNPVVHDRMHWTLAEAINSSAVLYHVTKKEEYAKDYEAFMEYLDHYVIDHVNGSWFHQLDEKNQLKETVWPGKSDLYHALQATLIPYLDPAVSIVPALLERK